MAFGMQFGISFALFLLWPVRMAHPILPAGIEGQILNSLYAFDQGFNSFPSLHVANIVFVSLLVRRLRQGWRANVVTAVGALITISTVLVMTTFSLGCFGGCPLGVGQLCYF